MTDVWFPIKTGTDLEIAARDTLRLWFPTYLREIELQQELGTDVLPLPKSYTISDELDLESGSPLPAIVIVSPGLSGDRPSQDGDGNLRASFMLAIGVIASSGTQYNTRKMVRVYIALARTIMLQKQSLGGFANGVTWLDESYDDRLTFVDDETISAGTAVFAVEVDSVSNRFGGPPVPDTEPGYTWGTVDDVIVTVQKEDTP